MDSDETGKKPKVSKINSMFASKASMKSRSTENAFKDELSSGNDSFVEVFRSYRHSVSVSQTSNATEGICGSERNCQLASAKDSFTSTSLSKPVQRKNNSPDFLTNLVSSSKIEQKSLEMSTLMRNDVVRHCPICFKKNTFDQSSSFISHLKKCAARNKVSPDKLLKAIQLLEKQASERLALGLPTVEAERSTVRKNYSKKFVMDSNMQLGMALSASLRESEMLTKLRETETLLEAGLEQEAISQCRQLEDFGFMSSKTIESKMPKCSSRSKHHQDTVLFTRTQSERERMITEKIALILVDSDKEHSQTAHNFGAGDLKLKSKFLLKHQKKDFLLWRKSYQLDEENSQKCYYVPNLLRCISPCKVEVGAKLKHVSQIPCRSESSDESRFSRNLQDLVDFFDKNPAMNPIKLSPKVATISKQLTVPKLMKSTLCNDWKSFVNKKMLSDVTIYVKNEKLIYAHKLVLHARCAPVLIDVIKETENGNVTEIIMWLEYCYDSVIAFLEFIYADSLESLPSLNKSQLSDVKQLCIRYHFKDLKEIVDQNIINWEPSEKNSNDSPKDDCENPCSFSSSDRLIPIDEMVPSHFSSVDEGEKNLMFLEMALKSQKDELVSSPEMFEKLETSHVADEQVDEDFSLSIYDSSPVFQSNNSITCDKACASEDTSHFENVKQSQLKTFSTFNNNASPNDGESKETISSNCVQWTCDTDVICVSDDEPSTFCNQLNHVDPIKSVNAKSDLSDAARVADGDADDSCDVRDSVDLIKFNEGKLTKRKPLSPLVKSPAKKEKLGFSMKSSLEKRYLKRNELKLPKKKSSQSYALSDSLESNDSDESLFKITISDDDKDLTCLNGDLPNKTLSQKLVETENFIQKTIPSNDKKDNMIINNDSSFELDDFRQLEPEIISIADSHDLINDKFNSMSNSEQEAHSNSCTKSENSEEVPYISPVWDGFEDANKDFFEVNISPFCSKTKISSGSKFSTPVKDLLIKTLTPAASLNIRKDSVDLKISSSPSNLARQSISSIPNFESFSIDESVLNKLENNMIELNVQGVQSQTAAPTPISSRKFQTRSKSDTFLTPSPRSNQNVTPMADYSGMRTCELKKELDKYGIKPGIGKNKAKKLLKHIYDKLHPFEGDITPKRCTDAKEKLKLKKSYSLKTYSISTKKEKSSTVSAESDNSSDSFASGIDILEASFAEDDINLNQNCAEDIGSQRISLDIGFGNLLRENKDLHTKVLLYEPIWLETLKNDLKEKGVKCSMSSLMNYLDEKGITFRTQHQRNVRRKKKKAVMTQRS